MADTLPALHKMLKDRDPQVRQKVALALANAGDKEAVPTLIALVNEVPVEQSGPAEDYLLKLARDGAPKEMPEGDEGRKKRSEMWQAWWKANESKVVMVDRFTPTTRERYLGYTVTVQANNNQIVEFGTDGKVRWTLTGLLNPWDAQVLPGNKVLVAEYNGQRVTERDLKGNILWQKQVASWPMSAERLRNGNTFIVCRNLLVEVDRSGKEVMKLDRPHDVMSARKLPSGQIVIITNNRQVVRMDRAGKELKTYTVPNIFYNTNEILDNGHVITPMGWMNQVVEYDAEGKEVNRFTVNQPNHACRLPNGNTVVASQNFPYKVFELDKKGKQVGELTTTNYAFRVRRR